ncbi:glycosyltransferase family 2 protein [Lysobacter sp. TAF61]|uniref:glycosyltransferase family 2 protein n=1 Tax=Lysobacter sp. TAF61 TaxID=3233072 RepID=UPI003F9C69DF
MALDLDAPVGEARPVCTVCIANYNGEALLGPCIESILAQDCGFAVEIIVHDDASTDGSMAFLRSHFPQVEVIASTSNVGFCVSNNRMVAKASGEFILLLNNDAALASDALRRLHEESRQRQRPSVLTLPQRDWVTGDLVDRGCLLDPFYNPVPNLDPSRSEVAYVIGACLWTTRDLYLSLGGLPDWMESIGEDLYLCCAARLQGVDVGVLPDSHYRHRQGASFGGNRPDQGKLSTTYRRRFLSERNKTAALLCCTPTAGAWLLLTMHLFVLLLEGLAVSIATGKPAALWRIYLPAIRSTLSGLPALRKRRKRLQQRRSIPLGTYFRAFTLAPRKLVLLFRHGLPTFR